MTASTTTPPNGVTNFDRLFQAQHGAFHWWDLSCFHAPGLPRLADTSEQYSGEAGSPHRASLAQCCAIDYVCRTQLLDSQAQPCVELRPQDQRFTGEQWHNFPFNLLSQSFLLTEQWWQNATTGIPGVSHHHEEVVSFYSPPVA